MIKKVISLSLATTVLVSTMVGCKSSDLKPYESNTPASSAEVSPSTEQVPEKKDYTYAYEKYAPNEVVATINGKDIVWKEYFYWMFSKITELESYFGEIEDWNTASPMASGTEGEEELTNAKYIAEATESIVKEYAVLETKAKELGVKLSEEDETEIAEYWKRQVDSIAEGDEAKFIEMLNEEFMDKEFYLDVLHTRLLFTRVYEHTFGKNAEKASEEEILDYAKDNGYVRAKHVLIQTTNEEGESLSDEEKVEKRNLAQEIATQLNAAEDKDAKINELIAAHGQDPGMETYKDGYTFTKGTMVDEFYEGALALEDGAVSDIIETSYGYHVILRLPVTTQSVVEYDQTGEPQTMAQIATISMMNALFSNWMSEATVEYKKTFKDFDVAATLNQ